MAQVWTTERWMSSSEKWRSPATWSAVTPSRALIVEPVSQTTLQRSASTPSGPVCTATVCLP